MASAAQQFSIPQRLAVREQAGLIGVREQQTLRPELLTPQRFAQLPADPTLPSPKIGGPLVDEHTRSLASAHQQRDTSRSFAPSAAYPGQARPAELNRQVVPKNHQEFELKGRNIGPHATANVIGGYAGRDMVDNDVAEKYTHRTHDDFNEYFLPKAATRFEKGTPAVYNQFDQNRIESRELGFKNAPGRFPGAFRHDLRLPTSRMDQLQQKEQYGDLKQTMKRDPAMTYRQRADENPNREGLRPQYSDNFSSGWETLENHRRVRHTVERTIDHSMLAPWYSNPLTPPIGIVPFSGQNSGGLNDAENQAVLAGKVPGQRPAF